VTNELGVDEDLATDPLLYVYPPSPERDSAFRPFQHILMPFPLSLLFAVWRTDSMKLCIKDMMSGFKRKTQSELGMQLLHYAVIFSLVPAPLVAAYIFLSGFMTAVIVTVTHQSEELFEEHNPDFVDAQFRSTRNAKCSNIFSDWLWGGMQWQLEVTKTDSMYCIR
jgi:Fatty acid desaturase